MIDFKFFRGIKTSVNRRYLLNYNRYFFAKCSERLNFDEDDYGILFSRIHTQVEDFIFRELLTTYTEIRSYYNNSTGGLTRDIIDDFLDMGLTYRASINLEL